MKHFLLLLALGLLAWAGAAQAIKSIALPAWKAAKICNSLRVLSLVRQERCQRRAAGSAINGEIGPATLAASNAAPALAYYDALTTTRWAFYQYRAGHPVAPPALVSLLQSGRLVPDVAMQRYLPGWLGRVAAIPYAA